jgi:predicted AAA+ superfamily ATPase
MIYRLAEARISDLLTRFPAVAVLGPRQVGKTTLARRLVAELGAAAVYLDLELPSHRAKLSDPELYFSSQEDRLVVLDEIQRVPGLFEVLRGVIDERRRQGRRHRQFLLLGSASIDLLQQSSETLAGRIAYSELTPLLAEEVATKKRGDRDRLWLRGGFPDSFLAADEAASVEWREEFIGTYLERDIPLLGPRIPAETLRRFWTMLAHEQGTLLNAASVAGAIGVSGQTVGRYLDLMVDLLLVRRLPPWSKNAGKRLVRSPKVYVRDSGLVHALLGLRDLDAVLGHPVTGGSWEGFVIENLLAAAPSGTSACFYRTAVGAEIDLVLDLPPKERWAIEIKRSSAPVLSKGFYLGCGDIKATRRMVVHAGEDTFGLGDGVEAVSLPGALAALRGRH